jgi:hypothetical protein
MHETWCDDSLRYLQAGCDESQAREYFTKMRSSVRGFLQRMHRKSTGHDAQAQGKVGSADTAASSGGRDESLDTNSGAMNPATHPATSAEGGEGPKAANPSLEGDGDGGVSGLITSSEAMQLEREAREEKLRNLLDADGGIAKPENVGMTPRIIHGHHVFHLSGCMILYWCLCDKRSGIAGPHGSHHIICGCAVADELSLACNHIRTRCSWRSALPCHARRLAALNMVLWNGDYG